MRLLNLIVAAALVLAAGYVYKSKFAATVEAERVAKLRIEIVRERDRIAALRAETAKLEAPARIEGLARRHLPLKPLDLNQIDTVDAVPFRPMEVTPRPADEPAIAKTDSATPDMATGSIGAPTPASRPASPPATSRPTSSAVASRPASAPAASRPPSPPAAARTVSPLIVRKPVAAPVASRPVSPPVTPRYAAPPDQAVAPLRPPADVWTNLPATEDQR